MTQSRSPRQNAPQPVGAPLAWGLLVMFLVAAAVTAYLTFVAVRDTVAAWSSTQLGGLPSASSAGSQPTAALNELGTPLPTMNVNMPLQEFGPTPQPWDGASRITILVMGYDYGDWSDERRCPCRTDTMILLTLDPLTQTGGMLSIPRDLWVNIPGDFGYAKINQAYYFGDAAQLPDGGPGLAMRTVEQFLGVPIDFYATIDFGAFEQFVDTIGGVEIDVPEEIKVDPVGPGNTVILQPGKQTLNGPVALAYARARYTEGGDFDRANRQQQVITAIGNRILSLDMLPTLISQAPVLYQELSSGIKTNLTLDQVIKLSWTAQQVFAKGNIKKGVISPPDQVILGTSPDGLDILIPVHDKIRALRDEIFTSGGASASPVATADLTTLMKEEAARVTILNGSGTDGLAGRTQDFLKAAEVNVVAVGTAEQLANTTTIIDYSGKPYTVRYLLEVMGLPENTPIYNSYDPNSETDVAVIVGADWAASNPMP